MARDDAELAAAVDEHTVEVDRRRLTDLHSPTGTQSKGAPRVLDGQAFAGELADEGHDRDPVDARDRDARDVHARAGGRHDEARHAGVGDGQVPQLDAVPDHLDRRTRRRRGGRDGRSLRTRAANGDTSRDHQPISVDSGAQRDDAAGRERPPIEIAGASVGGSQASVAVQRSGSYVHDIDVRGQVLRELACRARRSDVDATRLTEEVRLAVGAVE